MVLVFSGAALEILIFAGQINIEIKLGSRWSSTDDGWRETRNNVAGLMPEISALEETTGNLGMMTWQF